MSQGKVGIEIKELVPQVHRAATIFTLTVDHPDPNDVLDALGVLGAEVYTHKPRICPICKSKVMSTLEIIGVSTRPVFWECEECGVLLCACDKGWIRNRIKKLYHCWTVSEDWSEQPEKRDYN